MGLIIFKNGNTQTVTDPAYLLLQIKQMSPHPTPSLVVGFRTNRGISQNQNPMQNSLEFRAWILFFSGLSSIRHYSYVSINPSLDKKRRKTKRKSEEEILARGRGLVPHCPGCPSLQLFTSLPSPVPPGLFHVAALQRARGDHLYIIVCLGGRGE